MIAVWHSRNPVPKPYKQAMISALGRYGGKVAEERAALCDILRHQSSNHHFARHAQVSVALKGWIDNSGDLAAGLGLSTSDDATVYCAALARWGDDADKKCVGNYCSIAELPDGSLRLARSPWEAPPLYHHSNAERIVASPLLRVIFASGAPRELDYDRIIDELAYDYRDGEEAGWYCGVDQVPIGCSVTFGPSSRMLSRYYSVEALPKIRFSSDDDYSDAAGHLLVESAQKALAVCERPAVALSGGLDSPLVADALTRALPQRERLKAVTFIPHPDWDGSEPPGMIGNEEPLAREFARFNGRIELHIADPEQGGFDFRAREVFQASEIFAPGLANVGMFHGVWSKARELGCDMLLTADIANQTFSDNGRWAYVEYARRGKWAELLRLLRARPHDSRSLLRKMAALSILPQLPPIIRKRLRSVIHPQRAEMTALFTLLSNDARKRQAGRMKRRGGARAWADFTFPHNRQDAARQYALQANGPAADMHLAFEQIHRIARRDVAAYRPLIEFCLGLPTEQFASQGVERRLARRMAKDRLPEALRLETRHGQHNIDFYARVTPRREELLAYAGSMRAHPWLSENADIDRMCALIEHWPETSDFSWEEGYPRMMALPRIALAAQFIGFAEGSNEL